jgi:2,5-furandicarboxylate decarboxylase 1
MTSNWKDLVGFVDALRRDGDGVEISEKVSPRFEISAILQGLGEIGGPAALFSNVVGFPGQVIIGNVLAHRRRLAKAIGAHESNLIESYIRQKKGVCGACVGKSCSG